MNLSWIFIPYEQKTNPFLNEAINLYKQAILMQEEGSIFGINFADDGVFQKHFSKNCYYLSVEERIKPLTDVLLFALKRSKNIYVKICIEELSPFGYDLTDGIFIVQQFEDLGVKNFVFTVGSSSFLPLFNRKKTKSKNGQDDFYIEDINLASYNMVKKYIKNANAVIE